MVHQVERRKVFWIIGATSGIGRALAIQLASKGHQLILSGRRIENLKELKEKNIPDAGIYPLDINDTDSIKNAYQKIIDEYGQIDSFMFFSAQYEPMKVSELKESLCRHIIDTNYTSLFSILPAIIEGMRLKKNGQIILCASVAGYIGLPNAQPYASTKAAIINLAESMRIELDPLGIDVKIVSPGFVKTEMTDKNAFAMPMMITPEAAADKIYQQLSNRNKFEIKTHGLFTFIMKVLWAMPYRLYFKIIKNN
jgi:short-subunit dehydrogenase